MTIDTRKGCFSVTEMSGDAASHADWEYGLAMMDDREEISEGERGGHVRCDSRIT